MEPLATTARRAQQVLDLVRALAVPGVLLGIGTIALWSRPATADFYAGGGLVVLLLIGRYLAFPVSVSLAGAWLLVFVAVDWLPNSGAIAAHAARRWLPSENYLEMAALRFAWSWS